MAALERVLFSFWLCGKQNQKKQKKNTVWGEVHFALLVKTPTSDYHNWVVIVFTTPNQRKSFFYYKKGGFLFLTSSTNKKNSIKKTCRKGLWEWKLSSLCLKLFFILCSCLGIAIQNKQTLLTQQYSSMSFWWKNTWFPPKNLLFFFFFSLKGAIRLPFFLSLGFVNCEFV